MEPPKYTFHLLHHSSSGGGSINNNNSTNSNVIDDNNLSNENEIFEQKLVDIADQISTSGFSNPPFLANLVVESAVVSNQHLAFLLDNGRICRISYQYVNSNNKNNNNNNNTPSTSNEYNSANSLSTNSLNRNSKHSKLNNLAASNSIGSSNAYSSSNNPSGVTPASSASFRAQSSLTSSSAAASLRSTNTFSTSNVVSNLIVNNSSNANLPGSNLNNNNSTNNSSLRAAEAFIMPSAHDILSSSSSLSHSFGRGRRSQILRGRVSSLIVGSSRIPSLVSASAVPESLIESVQTVLQSKSRSVIIRELQRTVRFNHIIILTLFIKYLYFIRIWM